MYRCCLALVVVACFSLAATTCLADQCGDLATDKQWWQNWLPRLQSNYNWKIIQAVIAFEKGDFDAVLFWFESADDTQNLIDWVNGQIASIKSRESEIGCR